MAAFLDTNVLLYALAATSEEDAHKGVSARELTDRLTLASHFIVSAQVLSEFSANAAKKGRLIFRLLEIEEIVEKLCHQILIPMDASLVQLALHRVQQSRLSYWYALIVKAALRSGASTLYTEGIYAGTRYGTLGLRNQFLA